MPKESARSRKKLPARAAETSTRQVYKLQIGFDAEAKAMLDALTEDRRLPAAILVRQLILAEYRKLKGSLP